MSHDQPASTVELQAVQVHTFVDNRAMNRTTLTRTIDFKVPTAASKTTGELPSSKAEKQYRQYYGYLQGVDTIHSAPQNLMHEILSSLTRRRHSMAEVEKRVFAP